MIGDVGVIRSRSYHDRAPAQKQEHLYRISRAVAELNHTTGELNANYASARDSAW
jgi:hypothetical protein